MPQHTDATSPLSGASAGIISILLHMRPLLGPPTEEEEEEEGRRCEEEAADLISFSPSFNNGFLL